MVLDGWKLSNVDVNFVRINADDSSGVGDLRMEGIEVEDICIRIGFTGTDYYFRCVRDPHSALEFPVLDYTCH